MFPRWRTTIFAYSHDHIPLALISNLDKEKPHIVDDTLERHTKTASNLAFTMDISN